MIADVMHTVSSGGDRMGGVLGRLKRERLPQWYRLPTAPGANGFGVADDIGCLVVTGFRMPLAPLRFPFLRPNNFATRPHVTVFVLVSIHTDTLGRLLVNLAVIETGGQQTVFKLAVPSIAVLIALFAAFAVVGTPIIVLSAI